MSTSLSPLLAPMLSSATMRAICDDVAYLQNMLDFEAALARAEAATGVIPASAPGPIANACRAESFDLAALAEAATRSGNLAIPLVKALTASVAKADADAARYVHWGATSQDVDRYRQMLDSARGDRSAARRYRPRHGRLCEAGATHRNTAGRCPHLAAACAADAVRAQARRNMPRPCIVRASACSDCARDAGVAVRRRRRNAGRARRQGNGPSPNDWRRNSSCRCRTRHGTPIATASRKRLPCSPSSPAPAARSPATSP